MPPRQKYQCRFCPDIDACRARIGYPYFMALLCDEMLEISKPIKLSSDEFAEVWQAADSLGEVAQAANVLPVSATNRARRLRRRGYTLKTFAAGADVRIGDSDQFAEDWQAAASVEEVAKKYGIAAVSAYTRARILRTRGYDLKRFDTHKRDQFAEDWQAAASVEEMADKYGISIGSTYRKARRIRARGRQLKTLPRSKK